ncbi:transporter substrate-binding domain-containing protein [Gilvimarinus sp. SDUM040013]|uniref:Transporter substrate-binding domain-containing protein n=1 Tax=Gilvimarinus gilvus TaxID=3058038 RepID=A0ABU4S145_9GAMM|nr:transporter substrate-binding domain-containing protein [Gilvimarinus sp. SDUM040013]MDO3384792.1 transporter substrate-binding domain-containing protein [Gilvimarinus sp. SDUM040013]MDX6850875.1 transporter substrate-binding domain-containing protein [Gilvimarinus sp. SDUM040013]
MRLAELGKVLVLVSVFWGVTVNADVDNHVVRIAAEDSWPPFSDRNGQGLSKKIAEAAFAYSNYRLEISVVPYARALRQVEQGLLDGCWNVTRQANTEARYHFGEEPLLKADISFYYRAGTALHYTSFAEIPDGTQVGVIIDYEYGDEFEQHKHRFDLVSVSTQKSLLYMLNARRFDVVLMFDKVFESHIASLQLNPEDYRQGHSFYTSEIYIAFNASNKKAEIYSQALDSGLRQLRESGRYNEIMADLSP